MWLFISPSHFVIIKSTISTFLFRIVSKYLAILSGNSEFISHTSNLISSNSYFVSHNSLCYHIFGLHLTIMTFPCNRMLISHDFDFSSQNCWLISHSLSLSLVVLTLFPILNFSSKLIVCFSEFWLFFLFSKTKSELWDKVRITPILPFQELNLRFVLWWSTLTFVFYSTATCLFYDACVFPYLLGCLA